MTTTLDPACGTDDAVDVAASRAGTLEARAVSAWFGSKKVLERVSLTMPVKRGSCGRSWLFTNIPRSHAS